MKRYYTTYESDEIVCRNNTHIWGSSNSIKTAKQYIKRCREIKAENNPRNFKVFDTLSESECAECVYTEK